MKPNALALYLSLSVTRTHPHMLSLPGGRRMAIKENPFKIHSQLSRANESDSVNIGMVQRPQRFDGTHI